MNRYRRVTRTITRDECIHSTCDICGKKIKDIPGADFNAYIKYSHFNDLADISEDKLFHICIDCFYDKIYILLTKESRDQKEGAVYYAEA